MSITPSLRASARSAYRQLWRTARTTFSGDEPVFQAFVSKMRQDSIRAQNETDPDAYSSSIALSREITSVLQKNVVQATKVSGEGNVAEEGELWQLRLTKDTELGSNDSIKSPPPMPTRGGNRRQKCCSETPEPSTGPDIRNFSALKRAHKARVIPELKEADIEESFVRGSGPGGQAINKTMSNVQLRHKPTGIRVNCQETRSLELNRRYARRILLEKACLDHLYNPGLSKGDMKNAKQRERERQRRKKAKKKAKKRELENGGVENASDSLQT